MAFNGLGVFQTLAFPNYPAVSGNLITASMFNATITDLCNGLSNAVTRDGQSPASANLPMGGFRHTGVGAAVADTDYARFDQVKSGVLTFTNKTLNLADNTLTGTLAQFNAACSDADFLPVNNPTATGTATLNFLRVSNAGGPTSELYNTSGAAGQKYARWTYGGGTYKLEFVNDAYSAVTVTPIRIDPNGDIGFGCTVATPSGFARFLAIGDSDTGIGQITDGLLAFATNNVITARLGTNFTLNLNSGTGTHVFTYNENGGEIQLLDNAGAQYSLFDASVTGSTTRLLHMGTTGDLMLGMGSPGTGSTRFMKAGYAEAARVDASGNLLVTNVAGLGYGTGAGGTVTQATSKSTTVTLNKPTGQITMNNAALAAGASVNFAVNNSLVTTTDLVVVGGVNAGVDPINYRIEAARANGIGTFLIRVTNISAGSLSEALQIQFSIIKGATS